MSSLLNLESAVLKTICWFDIFNHPLTLFEIWQNLYWGKDDFIVPSPSNSVSLSPFSNSSLSSPFNNPAPSSPFNKGGRGILYKISDVQEFLEKSEALKKVINSQRGYYFLKSNNKDLVKIRTERYNIDEKKLKKAKKIIKVLARFPFIRMLGVCNTLAYWGADEDSDIDLFIVVEKDRIWWARFLCLSFLKIFNLRPKEDDLKDKFCLSFFVDNKHLDLKEVKIGPEDVDLNYWLIHILPIYDEKIYCSFLRANSWTKDYLPFFQEKILNQKLKVKLGILGVFFKKLSEGFINLFLGKIIENFLKNVQLKKLPQPLKDKINQGTDVVVKEGILKFHLNDRRKYYYKQWKEKVGQYET